MPLVIAILAHVDAHPFRVSRSPVINLRIIAAIQASIILMRDLIVRPPEMLFAHFL